MQIHKQGTALMTQIIIFLTHIIQDKTLKAVSRLI